MSQRANLRTTSNAVICALLLSCPVALSAQSASGGPSDSTTSSAKPSSAKKQAATPDYKPCSVIPDPDPCGTTPKPPAATGTSTSSAPPAAADRFPFPGSASADSTGAPAPSIGGIPDTPASASQPPAAPGDAARKFPFPGESPAPNAPSAPSLPAFPGPGGSSSSSSSSSGNDNSGALPGDASPDLNDAGSSGTQTKPSGHFLHRAVAPPPKPQTADDRETEDLNVAKYYLDTGDLQGAYLRTQDAVATVPDDPDAHFALAEIAAKLGRKDEAIAEYQACLKLDPSDKERKDSSRALTRLSK